MNYFSIRSRFLLFFIYFTLVSFISWYVTGSILPPISKSGIWFYSGLVTLIAGSLLESPFYTSPVTAFASSLFSLFVLIQYGKWGIIFHTEHLMWLFSTFYVSLILLSSTVAVFGYGSDRNTLDRIGDAGYEFISQVGGPRPLFSAVFLSALLSFHSTSVLELVPILLAWLAVTFRPLEHFVIWGSKVRERWRKSFDTEQIGKVVGHTVPGLLTVEHPVSKDIETGDLLLVPGDEQQPNIGVALGHVGIGEGLRLQVLQLSISEEVKSRLPKAPISEGRCAVVDGDEIDDQIGSIQDYRYENRNRLVGIVSPGTTTQELRFEVVRSGTELEEGRLIKVEVGGEMGLYQVTDGVTKEETVQQENKRGYAEAGARKIGYWDEQEEYFSPITWLPEPNTPVFLVEEQDREVDYEAVGYFPRTSYPVSVDTDDLVTHNSAILGILGIGKSYLSMELVERMIKDDINVICIDMTDQYKKELGNYIEDGYAYWSHLYLNSAGVKGKESYRMNKEEGGSINEFRTRMDKVIDDLIDDSKKRVLTIDPSFFQVWEQTGNLRPNEEASMGTLTQAQITQIIAESALQACQERGMTKSARCCIVFEEAHSLIPEFNAAASKTDERATNGTSRAILQGRKFGLGGLVVTQRTASVTKTILNQCNTIFSMRVFDDTGMEFLSNYIGDDYAEKLSNLDDRHMVVSGKASSCRGPVQVRVNDREDFLSVARADEEDG